MPPPPKAPKGRTKMSKPSKAKDNTWPNKSITIATTGWSRIFVHSRIVVVFDWFVSRHTGFGQNWMDRYGCPMFVNVCVCHWNGLIPWNALAMDNWLALPRLRNQMANVTVATGSSSTRGDWCVCSLVHQSSVPRGRNRNRESIAQPFTQACYSQHFYDDPFFATSGVCKRTSQQQQQQKGINGGL